MSDDSGRWRILRYMPTGGIVHNQVTGVPVSASVTLVTSISLTPGKWRLNGNVFSNGGTPGNTYIFVGIDLSNSAFTGPAGQAYLNFKIDPTTNIGGGAVPAYDMTVTANTTVYLLAQHFAATSNVVGYITAERIY